MKNYNVGKMKLLSTWAKRNTLFVGKGDNEETKTLNDHSIHLIIKTTKTIALYTRISLNMSNMRKKDLDIYMM